MKKSNKQLVIISFLAVVGIFDFFWFKLEQSTYAQLPSIVKNSSSYVNQNQDKSLTYNERLTIEHSNKAILISVISAIIAGCSTIVGIPAAILAFKQLKKKTNSFESILEKAAPALLEAFTNLINSTTDEKEKKELLEQKKAFEKEVFNLRKRSVASKNARKWLQDNREKLADQAVNHVLLKQSVTDEQREKFRLDVNRYLYGIHECLDIGNYDLINRLDIQYVLPNNFYKKALDFVFLEKISITLPSEQTKEIKIYFEYIINSFT
jgi:hypothetical protein